MSAAVAAAARAAVKGTKHWPHTAPKLTVSLSPFSIILRGTNEVDALLKMPAVKSTQTMFTESFRVLCSHTECRG